MKQFITNIFKGILIGIANIIPGLSGATLALILGIYEKTIGVLTKFDTNLLYLIKKLEFQKIKKHISFNFLIAIGLGVIISFIGLAKLLHTLFVHFETYTWAYFFGIIAASVFYITKYIEKWTKKEIVCFIIGFFISISIIFLEPNAENKNLFFAFICGMIGVIGMLIPGLSGSYLLVLLGNYQLLLVDTIRHITNPNLIEEENYLYVKLFFAFLVGQIIGILIFSRAIKWLIKNFKNRTFAILSGFVLGSLIYIWPWQTKTLIFIIQPNKPPTPVELPISQLDKLSYPNWELSTDIYTLLIMLIGIGTIVLIEQIARKYKNV